MSDKREEKKEKESKRLIAACILYILREKTGWRLGNGDIKTLTPAEIYSMLERGCGSDRVYDGVHVKDEDTVRENLRELLLAQEWTGVHCLEVDRLDDENYGEDRDPENETRKTKNIHYYVLQEDANTHLTQAEGAVLRSMLDSAVGIGAETKKRILKKLDAISESSSKMIGHLEAANMSGLDFDAFSDAINEICKAIRSRACISFTYWAYGVDKQLHLEKTVSIFEPIQLITHRGGQYLLGREKDTDSLRHYRVDRMRGVKPLHHLASDYPSDSIDQYLARHPYLGEGALTGAELLVKREAISTVIDEFGLELTLREEKNDCCRVEIRHVVLEDLLKFAMMHADVVEVVMPEAARRTLCRESQHMEAKYLKSPRDKFLAECEEIKAHMEGGYSAKNLRLSVNGCDLRRATEHIGLDIGTASFRDTQIADPSFLAGYPHLHTLCLDGNGFSDFSPLRDCALLSDLEIRNATIRSLDFLKGCESLRRLALVNCTVEDASALYRERYLDEIVLLHCAGIDIDLMMRCQQAIPTEYFIDKDRGNAPKWPSFPIHKQFSEYPYPLNMADEYLSVSRIYSIPETEKQEIYKKLSVDPAVVNAAEDMLLALSLYDRRALLELFKKGQSVREAAISLRITVEDVLGSYSQGRNKMTYLDLEFKKLVRAALAAAKPNLSTVESRKKK